MARGHNSFCECVDCTVERRECRMQDRFKEKISSLETELASLREENERLREACERLDQIDCCDGYSLNNDDYPVLWDALNLARAALSPKS